MTEEDIRAEQAQYDEAFPDGAPTPEYPEPSMQERLCREWAQKLGFRLTQIPLK